MKKTKLGKKRVLEKAKDESKKIKEEIIVIGDNSNLNQKDNSASFLLKLILKAYYLSLWKKKVKALKYYSRKINKQRMNFKKLINEISLVINQQKSYYLNEIIEKIDKLPLPKNIKHDKNFGTIKIVNKEVLNKKKGKKGKNKDINKNQNRNNMKDINYNENNKKYIEEKENKNIINNELIYEDGNKEMDFNNNDFKEDEYNTYENINENNDNYNKNNIIQGKEQNYNENEIEEDEAFIENEYNYEQDLANDYIYNNKNDINNNEYYQENNYYNNDNDFYENENNYIANEEYYYGNNIYNDEIHIPNRYLNNNNFFNNKEFYYPNEYNYYYNQPKGKTFYPYEEEYYTPLNKVNYIKTSGNNVLISDIYMKPKIEKNQAQYYYNKNNYGSYSNINNYQGNKNIKRAFPSCSHNHVFYISKK